jgi:Leucine-rich repeat (LRR) protein
VYLFSFKFIYFIQLYLSDNRLSSGLENLEGCPNLTLLVLAGNKFKSMDELKPLVS